MADLDPTRSVITAVLAYVCHVLLVCGIVCLGNGLSMLITAMYLTMRVDAAPASVPLILMPLSFLVASLTCLAWRYVLMADQDVDALLRAL